MGASVCKHNLQLVAATSYTKLTSPSSGRRIYNNKSSVRTNTLHGILALD